MWIQYVDRDETRKLLYQAVIDGFRSLSQSGDEPRIIDLGCGEGQFLRFCRDAFENSRLVGVDFCPSMLKHATERSVSEDIVYHAGDFELDDLSHLGTAHLVTAHLSLTEASDVEGAFRNIRSMLRDSGIAAIIVLDSTTELIRYQSPNRRPDSCQQLFVGEHYGLAMPFKVGRVTSPQPYFRIIRPVSEYIATAKENGLSQVHWTSFTPEHSGADKPSVPPRYEIIFFKKS